jgi:hypothetical protein
MLAYFLSAFLAAVPPKAALVDALNMAGVAIPGQAVQIVCVGPTGVAQVFYLLGDMPMPSITLHAADCAMPAGYVRSF